MISMKFYFMTTIILSIVVLIDSKANYADKQKMSKSMKSTSLVPFDIYPGLNVSHVALYETTSKLGTSFQDESSAINAKINV